MSKRSRISRRSSIMEDMCETEIIPSANLNVSIPSREKILTIASPPREEESVESFVNKDICGFLRSCFTCKNNIHDRDDVYMYSYLRAFCSSECRDWQIAQDTRLEKASQNASRPRTRARTQARSITSQSPSTINNMKGEGGAPYPNALLPLNWHLATR